jgi:hypothetical protein
MTKRCFSCGTEDVSDYLADAGCGEFDEVSCCNECYEVNEGFDGEVTPVRVGSSYS